METKSLTWWLDVILKKEMNVKDGTGYSVIINEIIERLKKHEELKRVVKVYQKHDETMREIEEK